MNNNDDQMKIATKSSNEKKEPIIDDSNLNIIDIDYSQNNRLFVHPIFWKIFCKNK